MKKHSGQFGLHIALLIALIACLFTPTVFSSFVMSNEKIPIDVGLGSSTYVATNASTGISYYSVEKALATAKKEETIYIIPNSGATIYKDCTVASGVKLYVPNTSNETNKTYTYNNIADKDKHISGGNEYQAYCYESTYLKNTLIISEGVTLTNKGNIYIDGIQSGGSGGNKLSGYTAQDYSQILMKINSCIDNSGMIECAGYILEEEANNGSSIINRSGSSIYAPFSVVEHRGGTLFKDMAGTDGSKLVCAPFNRFKFNNISSFITFESGSYFYGVADLRTGTPNQANITTVSLIGRSNNFLVNLSSTSSKLTYKYYQENYTSPVTGEKFWAEVGYIDIYGNFSVNSLTLTIDAIIIKATLSTSKVLFPLSYLQQVKLHRDINGNKATGRLNQQLKIMPGSSLIIDEGVTLDASTTSIISYNSYTDSSGTVLDASLSSSHKYPTFNANLDGYTCSQNSDKKITSESVGPGKLIVSGSLSVSSLAGNVITQNKDAELLINQQTTVVSKELYSSDPSYLEVYPNSAYGNIYTESTGVEQNAALSPIGYVSTSYTTSSGTVYAWEASTNFNRVFIELHPENGEDATTLTIYTKETTTYRVDSISVEPTKVGYVFSGWYTKADGGEKIGVNDGETYVDVLIDSTLALYAHWSPEVYTVTYQFVDNEDKTIDRQDKVLDNSNNPTEYTYGVGFTLQYPNSVAKGYKLYSWKLVNIEDETYSNINTISATQTGNLIIVGLVGEAQSTIYINFTIGKNNNFALSEYSMTYSEWNATKGVPDDIKTSINDDFKCTQYLEGNGTLYIDETLSTIFDVNTEITEDITLYVKWNNKSSLTINSRIKYDFNTSNDERKISNLYYCTYTSDEYLTDKKIYDYIAVPDDAVLNKFNVSDVGDFTNDTLIKDFNNFNKDTSYNYIIKYYYSLSVVHTATYKLLGFIPTSVTLDYNGSSISNGFFDTLLENTSVSFVLGAVKGKSFSAIGSTYKKTYATATSKASRVTVKFTIEFEPIEVRFTN